MNSPGDVIHALGVLGIYRSLEQVVHGFQRLARFMDGNAAKSLPTLRDLRLRVGSLENAFHRRLGEGHGPGYGGDREPIDGHSSYLTLDDLRGDDSRPAALVLGNTKALGTGQFSPG